MKSSFSGAAYLSCYFFITLIIIIGSSPHSVKAEIFGITLDNSCLTQLKYNLTTNCPTYDLLNQFYNNLECGYQDKTACLEYYKQNKITDGYIIDPSASVMDKIKLITIRSNFVEYILPDTGGYNNTDRTINYGLGRFVDSCRLAYIDSKQWFSLLGDTIMYLDSKCTKTNHISERSVYLNSTKHNIADSYKWKLELWQKEVINNCGTRLCLYVANQSSPP